MNADNIIDFVTALWLGFIGACIGSFLNVVAYRLPRGMSVVWQPSHCPKCNHPIRARDNIPILGWLWLGGKCRDCKATISPRYAVVEGVMGLVFFTLAYFELLRGSPVSELTGAMDVVWDPQWKAIGLYAYHCLLASILMAILLMRMDKSISLRKFILGAFMVVFLWPLAWFLSRIN
ncbi:prepilin peptidase [Bythopirellula goksoeyrii]|uniref:Leader peptidase PppA n=1 Tax=Bythopirellula goksoeyrii TaxID=1400387 RepID=A0A5B9Q8T3_9BACT|nr:prepilin peptidase [Bythopirellula goksoeyrii]QEG35328.1 Leader peptidase PppA [Bythopirellula goksoeyrii]